MQPSDFEDQMKALAEEAQKRLPQEDVQKQAPPEAVQKQPVQPAPQAVPPQELAADPMSRKGGPTFLQMLRPLVLGLEALSRATVENTMVLNRLEAASNNHDVLPRIVTEIQEKFENKNEINQKLFDALHQELKGYKDGFILEVLQKPLVRDLITLYDDLSEIQRQMDSFVKNLEAGKAPGAGPTPIGTHMNTMGTNLDHVRLSLVEIMARMEVIVMEPCAGKLNKATQRAVSVELADSENEDGEIARSVKPGFMWRERLVRPEEVVIKKWKEGFLVAINNEGNDGNEVQSGTTDAK